MLVDDFDTGETLGGPYAWGAMSPIMLAPMHPYFACDVLESRHCPAVYGTTCQAFKRSCARYESRDIGPWLPEMLR